jgi:hypothetical protein
VGVARESELETPRHKTEIPGRLLGQVEYYLFTILREAEVFPDENGAETFYLDF